VALLEVRNLSKVFAPTANFFGGSRSGVRAVDDVSLDIQAGETMGLVGESGSGKSTLGRLILRLIDPTSGGIRFDGRDLLAVGAGELRRVRRHMQIIFQDPFSSLDPRMRVEDLIAEPLTIHRKSHEGAPHLAAGQRSGSIVETNSGRSAKRTQIQSQVSDLLRAVGLDSSAMRRYPHEFSGGQRQRIVIARALALRPKFIVCDEPVSALDVSVGAQIVNLLAQLQREFGLTYLFISHSMPLVRYLSTRIAVMHRGRIVELNSTEQITRNPQDAYTQSLLDSSPEITLGM
jgi:ABC-type glutathione transport system ATPase component